MADRTIETDATSREEADPELATVEVTAIETGDSVSIVQERVRDCSSTIRESLAEIDVSDDHVRTVTREVEETSEVFHGDEEVPYRATERLHVDCLPETAPGVVSRVLEAGATVPNVQFDLHEETKLAMEEAALEDAIGRAREKAELITAAEGLSLGPIQRVSTNDVTTGMNSVVREAMGRNHDSDFQPDPITVTASVNVVFEVDE